MVTTTSPDWKTIRNNTGVLPLNEQILGTSLGGSGKWVLASSQMSYRDQVRAFASWHRPKPIVLTPTTMQIEEICDNTEIYEVVSGSGKTINGKRGTAKFVYGSYAVQSEVFTSGDGMSELNRALAKSTDFSFGVSIAESKETISFIAKNIRRITSFGVALKRGDLRLAQDVLNIDLSRSAVSRLKGQSMQDRLASGYLEFQFGLMPLLNDVSNVAKAYEQGLATRGLKISAHAGLRSSVSRQTFSKAWSQGPQSHASFSGRVVNPRLRDLNSLGLLNVPQIIYNVQPLSFVLDWFIPIGTYLGGATAGAGLENTLACVVTSTQTRNFLIVNGQKIPVSMTQTATRSVTSPSPSLLGLAPSCIRSFGQLTSLAALAHTKLGTRSRYK